MNWIRTGYVRPIFANNQTLDEQSMEYTSLTITGFHCVVHLFGSRFLASVFEFVYISIEYMSWKYTSLTIIGFIVIVMARLSFLG